MGGKGGDGGGMAYMPQTPTYHIDPATGWMIDDSGDVYEMEGGGRSFSGGADAFGGGNIKRYVGRKSELAELGGTPKAKPAKVKFDPGKPPVYTPPKSAGLPPPSKVPAPTFTAGGGAIPQAGLGDALGAMWAGAPMKKKVGG